MEGIRYEVEYFDVIQGLPKEHTSESVNLDNDTKPLEEHEYAVVHVYPLDNVEAYTDVYVLVGGLENLADGSLTEEVFRQRIKTKHAGLPYTKSIALTPEEVGLSIAATVEDVIRRIAQPTGTSKPEGSKIARAITYGGASAHAVHYFDYTSMAHLPRIYTEGVDVTLSTGGEDNAGRECAILHIKPYHNYEGYTDLFMFVGGMLENQTAYEAFVNEKVSQITAGGKVVKHAIYNPEQFGTLPEDRGDIIDWINVLSGFRVGQEGFTLPPKGTVNTIRRKAGALGVCRISYFDRVTMEPVWVSPTRGMNLTSVEKDLIFVIAQVYVTVPFIRTEGNSMYVIPQVYAVANAPAILKGNAAIVNIREWVSTIFDESNQAWGFNKHALVVGTPQDSVSSLVFNILKSTQVLGMSKFNRG